MSHAVRMKTSSAMGLGSTSCRSRSHPKRAPVTALRANPRAGAKRRVLIVYAGSARCAPGQVMAASAHAPKVNVLVVGGGGREHALCWRLRQAPTCDNLFCTPGNAGISAEEGVQVVDVKDTDHAAVVAFCKENDVGA